jgi:hypothetical protein
MKQTPAMSKLMTYLKRTYALGILANASVGTVAGVAGAHAYSLESDIPRTDVTGTLLFFASYATMTTIGATTGLIVGAFVGLSWPISIPGAIYAYKQKNKGK